MLTDLVQGHRTGKGLQRCQPIPRDSTKHLPHSALQPPSPAAINYLNLMYLNYSRSSVWALTSTLITRGSLPAHRSRLILLAPAHLPWPIFLTLVFPHTSSMSFPCHWLHCVEMICLVLCSWTLDWALPGQGPCLMSYVFTALDKCQQVHGRSKENNFQTTWKLSFKGQQGQVEQ